jgi:hypothetical protein
MRLAPASASSTACAAPPAPNNTTVLPEGSTKDRSAVTKPRPSVFSPIGFSLRRTKQFTAPISAADSPSPSRMVDLRDLVGIEQLNPIHPIARAPAAPRNCCSGPGPRVTVSRFAHRDSIRF